MNSPSEADISKRKCSFYFQIQLFSRLDYFLVSIGIHSISFCHSIILNALPLIYFPFFQNYFMVLFSYFPFNFTGTCGSLAEILGFTCPSEILWALRDYFPLIFLLINISISCWLFFQLQPWWHFYNQSKNSRRNILLLFLAFNAKLIQKQVNCTPSSAGWSIVQEIRM